MASMLRYVRFFGVTFRRRSDFVKFSHPPLQVLLAHAPDRADNFFDTPFYLRRRNGLLSCDQVGFPLLALLYP